MFRGLLFKNLLLQLLYHKFGRPVRFLFRAKTAIGYLYRPLTNLFKWLIKSQEITNFTYDLEKSNKNHLASLIANLTNIKLSLVMGYIKEIEEDMELKKHITETTAKSNLHFMADDKVNYGRRIGWYAFVRILKPKVVIETGIDKGLGACLLTAALKKNKQEGHEGYYYGTDINSKAGYLLCGDYANYGDILYGDSIESLKKLDDKIEIFINDSDHSTEYEAEEYKTIENKLSKKAIILGDNSHCTDELFEFSKKTNRQFIYFQEKPFNHWYPGAGIGISYKKKNFK